MRFQPSQYSDAAAGAAAGAAIKSGAGVAGSLASSGGNPYLAAFTSVIGAVSSGFNFFGTKKAAEAAVAQSRDTTKLGLAAIQAGREQTAQQIGLNRETLASQERITAQLVPALMGLAVLAIGYKLVAGSDFGSDEEEA